MHLCTSCAYFYFVAVSSARNELILFQYKKRKKNLVYILKLSQKSDFQYSNTKLANICHLAVKIGQIWCLEKVVLYFLEVKTI